MAKLVGEARDQGRLGADDDEIDAELAGEGDERCVVVRADGVAVRERRDPRIARRGMELVAASAAGERPDEGMLPPSRTDDERPHGAILCEGRDTLRAMDAPPYSAAAVDVLRLPAGTTERDRVAVEEPLEIRIGGTPVAVTMRTPGHDEELALGFCLSEGLRPRDARLPDDLAANTVDVDAPGFDAGRLQRSFYTSSSCGVCGKGALEAVEVEAPRVESQLRVPLALVASLPERLREAQAAFAVTGGLHATGLFSGGGEPLCVREDVGRHNALDKVVGWAFREQLLPLAEHVLCVSGRLSFELVQKAAIAGCPVLVAVGAPSSLAVDLAADRGITLCGFVRGGSANVYTEPWRIEG
jgi:FdhD protein